MRTPALILSAAEGGVSKERERAQDEGHFFVHPPK
jgi:hypothetical protein